jgi:hypothetical protein
MDERPKCASPRGAGNPTAWPIPSHPVRRATTTRSPLLGQRRGYTSSPPSSLLFVLSGLFVVGRENRLGHRKREGPMGEGTYARKQWLPDAHPGERVSITGIANRRDPPPGVMMHERLRNSRVGGLPLSETWPSGAEASKCTMSDLQVHQTCPGTGMMAMVALEECCPLLPASRIMLPGH